MSDNKLLTENTIRRFMQLANTEAMTDTFLEGLPLRGQGTKVPGTGTASSDEIMANVKKAAEKKRQAAKGTSEGFDEEDTLEENEEETELEESEETDLEENLEDLEEQEEDEEMEIDTELDADMDAGMDAEPEMGAADMSLTEEEAQLLISLGERLAAAMEGAGADDAPADDAPAMDDMEEPEGEEMEDPEAPGYRAESVDQDELVNEVLKRVTKRLVAAKLNRK